MDEFGKKDNDYLQKKRKIRTLFKLKKKKKLQHHRGCKPVSNPKSRSPLLFSFSNSRRSPVVCDDLFPFEGAVFNLDDDWSWAWVKAAT
jgi:hypothetical protein